ncbi:glucans biosynthesis glucosyltransferase MdoH [Halopseudomonas pelagia]|uniref:glucans biosynthesis glucosyltransferase MdoH n=1 Tax=Halopseudomonas pelagia TaxID=553151 RepID=UPI00039DB93B|nr:glucans biosynthesis glucosyltransferase MdoH [Halopseudomonas pelagia]
MATPSSQIHADLSRQGVGMGTDLGTDMGEDRGEPQWKRAAYARRALLLFAVLLQTATGSYFMLSVLPYNGGNWVEIGMVALFAILFCWISVGFWIGVFGYLIRHTGGDRHALIHQQDAETLAATPLACTAIIMPIYNEQVTECFGRLKAVYLSLQRCGQLEHFDFYILSDTRDANLWLDEQAAWAALTRELNAEGRLYYRRRPLNQNYKSGNVGDFLRRWGRDYPYMVVLDADSLMSGGSLVKMVQLMQRHPRVGILQSSPSLMNGQSVFARVQQFSNQLYGPLFTTGLAAFQLGDAAFWGHNAILRTQPFMQHCGLRKLPGWGLFRGPILSHDFVEAAYIGRAGHEVRLEPELEQSYEESPPTLVEELTRDKRWAKGNLQHLWLMLRSRRLRMAHRMAFLNGIMSYAASPLWLAFLVLATIAAARMVIWPIDYFPDPHQLHPVWPEWEPLRALALILVTFALLFIPKFLAVLDAISQGRARSFGGLSRMHLSVLMEMLISALLAPIRMLSHTRFVLEALFNLRLKWAGQNRSGESGWGEAIVNQAFGTLLALSWSAFAYWVDPMFFIWSLPVAIPLIFAAPVFVLLSRTQAGQSLKRWGLLKIPEETYGSELLDDLTYNPIKHKPHPRLSAFSAAVIDPRLNALHVAQARRLGGAIRIERLQFLRQQCLAEGPDSLSAGDRNLLARDGPSLAWLHQQVWQSCAHSVWADLLRQV